MSRTISRFRYFLLLLPLIPFVALVMRVPDGDRMGAWLASNGEMPLLAGDSNVHFLFAAASLAIFFAAATLLLDRDRERPRALLAAAAFTATIGILLLLAVQRVAADSTQEEWTGDWSWILLHYVLQGIAYSYGTIDHHGGSIWLQLIAFTFSVGLCEELTKLVPVLYLIAKRRHFQEIDARVVGFMSGVGFGVAEGIMYSRTQYNGTSAAIVYEVRFLSVVAMHAMATAVAAGLVVRHHVSSQSGWSYFAKLVWVTLPVMVLHALYDTLCDRTLLLWAFATEIALFGMLAYQIHTDVPRRSIA